MTTGSDVKEGVRGGGGDGNEAAARTMMGGLPLRMLKWYGGQHGAWLWDWRDRTKVEVSEGGAVATKKGGGNTLATCERVQIEEGH